ncbi:DUF4352 domain-containing protein [Streptomyces sp. NPDC048057]|uniref:DUF4352 domain-containing protein n=1 Tax=Streptomyces sp. NPDC048057 TaxID=3155628 RepID=UPI0033E189A3
MDALRARSAGEKGVIIRKTGFMRGPIMRRMASALLLSALALGATGCQGASDDRTAAASAPPGPAAVADAALDRPDGKGPDGGKGPGGTRRAVWVGDAVDLGGRASGEHLRMTVRGYVDPAVAVRKTKRASQPRPQPSDGRRWIGADVALLNVGGSLYDARRTTAWVTDDEGKRYAPLSTTVEEFTTGIPLKWNTLAVGEQSEGWLVFDVPEEAHITRFHSTLGKTTVTWLLQHPPSR